MFMTPVRRVKMRSVFLLACLLQQALERSLIKYKNKVDSVHNGNIISLKLLSAFYSIYSQTGATPSIILSVVVGS